MMKFKGTWKTMYMIMFVLMTVLIPVGWAVSIDWIQSNERVVGENSPLYDDVVNRPTKQIWGIYTSQHTTTGEHKPEIFPTPLPTPTPAPLSNYVTNTIFEVEHNPDGTHTIATGGGLPVFHNISTNYTISAEACQEDIYYITTMNSVYIALPNITSVVDGSALTLYLRQPSAVTVTHYDADIVLGGPFPIVDDNLVDSAPYIGDYITLRKYGAEWVNFGYWGQWEESGGS